MKLKTQKKKSLLVFVKKALIIFIILILSLYLGIKILINLLFLSSKFLPNKNSDLPVTPFLESKPSLTLLSIPEATNSSTIKANLYVENTDKIEVYLNDKLKKTITPEDNNIEIELDDLQEGENIIYFIGFLGKKNEKTKEFLVKLDSTPPELEILSPLDKQTSEEQIEIKGKTEPNVTVKINSSPVIVASDGSFSKYIFLKEGENKITIEAKDTAGNTAVKELIISRNT